MITGGTTYHIQVGGFHYSSGDSSGILRLSVTPPGLQYFALASPVRLLDTRAGATVGCDLPAAPLAAGDPARVEPGRNTCGIPLAARTLIGNGTVAVGGPTTPGCAGAVGYITLYPSDAPARPTVANVNYTAGAIVNTAYTVGLGAAGAFKIYASTCTEFIVDVSGYFAP